MHLNHCMSPHFSLQVLRQHWREQQEVKYALKVESPTSRSTSTYIELKEKTYLNCHMSSTLHVAANLLSKNVLRYEQQRDTENPWHTDQTKRKFTFTLHIDASMFQIVCSNQSCISPPSSQTFCSYPSQWACWMVNIPKTDSIDTHARQTPKTHYSQTSSKVGCCLKLAGQHSENRPFVWSALLSTLAQ